MSGPISAPANPRDFTGAIAGVIDLALEVMRRPQLTSRLPAITAMTEAIDAARAVMVEGGDNPIRGETSMLLEALAHIEAERTAANPFRAGEWCMVAGVLFPMVQQNLALALALKARRPSTADHDFRSRGRA